jgi:hypothetical protein
MFLVFNEAPRYEDVWGFGGMAPHIYTHQMAVTRPDCFTLH